LYKTAHLHVWKKDPKTIMSHYEVCYAIVMAWFGVKIQKSGNLLTSAKRLYDDFSTITPNMAASFTKRAKHVNDNSLILLLVLFRNGLVLIFTTFCLRLQKNLSVASVDGQIQQVITTKVTGFVVSALVAVTNVESIWFITFITKSHLSLSRYC
jgi:zinc transporter ZupT